MLILSRLHKSLKYPLRIPLKAKVIKYFNDKTVVFKVSGY